MSQSLDGPVYMCPVHNIEVNAFNPEGCPKCREDKGEEIPFEEGSAPFKVEIMKPEGPIEWEGFDNNGNYGIIYENGAETWISAELIKDDQIPYSPGI